MTDTIVWELRALSARWRGRGCARRYRRAQVSHVPGRHRAVTRR